MPELFVTNLNYKYPGDTELEFTEGKRLNPVRVANGNIVTYTIRVFNEGTMLGTAGEIRNELPEGLEFLPNHATNQIHEWQMYYENEEGNLVQTNDVSSATEVRTRYLSNKSINPFDSARPIEVGRPDFEDVRNKSVRAGPHRSAKSSSQSQPEGAGEPATEVWRRRHPRRPRPVFASLEPHRSLSF